MPAAWVSAAAAVGGLLMNSKGSGGSSATADQGAADAARVGREQWEYYKANYQPLETSLIGQAQAAGSPEEYERNRGKANADVTGAFDTARKNTLSRMQSYGINPGSPAFQSAAASTDLAEGSTKAGALTAADQNTRNLAYSKALDVVGLGRNIPAQSAASSTAAANAATAASKNRYTQNALNAQNVGYGIQTVGTAARKWFGQPATNPNANYTDTGTIAGPTTYGDTYSMSDQAYGAKGGKVSLRGIGYADGGLVDAEKTGDDSYDATALKGVLQKKGLNPRVAHSQAHGAARRAITPHMRRFASGGGVGRQGLEAQPDASNLGELQGPGTETSDSIPATIDGQQPAALSSGEVVMNAEVPKLSGDEILQALNDAGLRKRQSAGLEPQAAANEGGEQAYADGGEVGGDEQKFQAWYAEHAKARGLNPNPDDPQHFYDYRAAYRAGAKPDESGHWPSQFKREGHPRMVVDGINTKTGKPAYARGGRVARYADGGLVGDMEEFGNASVNAAHLRNEINRGAEAQRTNRVFAITREQKDAVKAIDSNLNRKEEEEEMYRERANRSRPSYSRHGLGR